MAKSFNGLWDQLMTDKNISESIANAHRGKGKKLKQKKYRLLVYLYHHRLEPEVIERVRGWILNYRNNYREPVEIKDGSSGKIRKIYAPTVKELVVQHCIVNVLKRYLLPMINAHTYGSVPGKGSQDAVKYIMNFIREHPDQCKYCCKMDHKKYFDSIPQALLINKLRKKIRDHKFMCLIAIIIMYIPGGYGLPIGFYTSQLLGVWYLYDSDEYINNTLKHKGVSLAVRWMDDVYFFGPDKPALRKCMYDYMVYTKIHQELTIKSNYQVFRFSYIDESGNERGRFLDAMGYRFYCNRVILRKSIMLRMTRKIKSITRSGRHRLTVKDCRAVLSYNGYLKVTKTYNVFKSYIKPYISFKYCKQKISDSDKRRKLNEQLDSCYWDSEETA